MRMCVCVCGGGGCKVITVPKHHILKDIWESGDITPYLINHGSSQR
jgi:hypothetical protein